MANVEVIFQKQRNNSVTIFWTEGCFTIKTLNPSKGAVVAERSLVHELTSPRLRCDEASYMIQCTIKKGSRDPFLGGSN